MLNPLTQNVPLYTYCIGKPVQINMGPASEIGIVKAVEKTHIILSPYLVRDMVRGNLKEQTDNPFILPIESIGAPQIISEADYLALQEPHPWRKLEGQPVRLFTKSSTNLCGILEGVYRAHVRISPFLHFTAENIATEVQDGVDIMLGDALAPMPIPQDVYEGMKTKKQE